MKLFIKQLSLENFKGIKKLTISFNELTNISGCNASGKSTIFDAFTWLLFGKDQFNRADFEIKTIDENGTIIPRLEHTVTGIFDIDDVEVKLVRTLKEKWVKQKGSDTTTFTGNETIYFKNDVPMSQKEYQDYINGIIPESTFKLLTVPSYFNSIKWQERRAFLYNIADIPSEEDIAGKDLAEFLEKLRKERKSVIELRRELANKKKLLKAKLDEIPGRLDEAKRATPESKDFDAIGEEMIRLGNEIKDIEAKIIDRSKSVQDQINQRTNALNQKHNLETRILDLTTSARHQFLNASGEKDNKINQLRGKVNDKKAEFDYTNKSYQNTKNQIAEHEVSNDSLRASWMRINATKFEFDESKTICPTCKQELPSSDINSMKKTLLENFNIEKQRNLDEINNKGKQNKEQIIKYQETLPEYETKLASLELEINDLEKQIEVLEKTPSNLKSVEVILSENPDYIKLTEELNSIVIPEIDEVDTSDLTSRKLELNRQLDTLKAELNTKTIIEQQQNRRAELLKEETSLYQQISDIESVEFQCELFTKRQMEAVENSVNSMFPTVRWRMFEQQINGGEAETCICLINGVPFSDANTAARLNAGIEIINVFSQKLNKYAPIWVDNAEAVNNINIPNGQLVALSVTRDKKLTINSLADKKVA